MRHAIWLIALCCAATGSAQENPASPAAESFARAMLAGHNNVRSELGLPPLVWSDRLAAFAAEWANNLLATNEFFHRPNNRFGENLFMITGTWATPGEVIRAWAGEARDYNYTANSCRSMCGHYTQMVWKTTKSVGCAVARAPRHEVWACNYDPPGNWVGQRPW